MGEHYILEGHTAVKTDLMTWARQFEEIANRRVARTEFEGGYVSTVFLGLDHQWHPGGPPLIFETMIFGGPHDGYQERYSTWEEAEAGHAVAVSLATAEPPSTNALDPVAATSRDDPRAPESSSLRSSDPEVR